MSFACAPTRAPNCTWSGQWAFRSMTQRCDGQGSITTSAALPRRTSTGRAFSIQPGHHRVGRLDSQPRRPSRSSTAPLSLEIGSSLDPKPRASRQFSGTGSQKSACYDCPCDLAIEASTSRMRWRWWLMRRFGRLGCPRARQMIHRLPLATIAS